MEVLVLILWLGIVVASYLLGYTSGMLSVLGGKKDRLCIADWVKDLITFTKEGE